MNMIGRLAGLAVGLILGFVWVVHGFDEFVLVGLVGLAGFIIGGVAHREFDLLEIGRRLAERR